MIPPQRSPKRQKRQKLFDEEFLARLERLHLIAKRLAFRASGGTRRSRQLGDGLEFADHRDYALGDDIRFIDWLYYARMEKLLLRLFHQRSEADVAILLDVSASMAPGGGMRKFHYALRTAAALAYVAMGSLDRVSLVPFAEDLHEPMRTGRNRGRIFAVLDFLAALTPQGPTRLAPSALRFVRTFGGGGSVMVISDFVDSRDQLPTAMSRLGQGGWDASAIQLYDPADADPKLSGAMLLRGAESPAEMTVQITDELRRSYRDRWRRFLADCERACISRGARYVASASDVPFEQLVLGTLRRAGVLSG